jgi:hypothetical protein
VKIRSEIEAFDSALRQLGRLDSAKGEERYLKSDFDFLGATTPELRRLTKSRLRSNPELAITDLRRLSTALFSRRIQKVSGVTEREAVNSFAGADRDRLMVRYRISHKAGNSSP